ncbi:MAG: tyrosine-type recombinase/integrase [Chloroflexi bacterium]|nr:tyrosine-type recombinase/integrase [Chloroflexota bacterium]
MEHPPTTLTDQALTPTAPAQPLDENPAAVYLASLSAGGRRTMRGALNTIAGLLSNNQADALTLPWARVRFQHAQAVRTRLTETYAPATVNKMLSALRGTLRAAWQLGQMDAETYHQTAAVASVKGTRLPAGRSITPGELAALLRACENAQDAAGVRDAAIVALLYSAGLRRAELVALDVADYDQTAGTLRIRGKGDKERLAHIVGGTARALADWLTLRGTAAGPLFWPGRKSGAVYSSRLTAQAVYYMLKSRAQQAGIADLSPHDFRRSFVGDLLDAGADIATVQALAGHAQVTTTARYDRRPEGTRRKAAELLHVPYRGTTLPVNQSNEADRERTDRTAAQP